MITAHSDLSMEIVQDQVQSTDSPPEVTDEYDEAPIVSVPDFMRLPFVDDK